MQSRIVQSSIASVYKKLGIQLTPQQAKYYEEDQKAKLKAEREEKINHFERQYVEKNCQAPEWALLDKDTKSISIRPGSPEFPESPKYPLSPLSSLSPKR